MQVTIYTTPNCVQCRQTKRKFDQLEVPYDAIDLTQHPELLEQFKRDGLVQAPIVVVGDGIESRRWSGFRLEKIKDTADEVHSKSY